VIILPSLSLFKIADLSVDKTLQILTLQVLASLDFDPEVIGRCFEEEVRQEVIEINERYKLENLIKDEEINEHIKLALIIRGRILSSQQKEWAEMDLETEQSNLTISSILPDITVSELKEIDPQHLINWLNHGIEAAIENGLSEETAKK
jgi:diphthamide synthase (EF-2-diphthine--ammonia ligase)